MRYTSYFILGLLAAGVLTSPAFAQSQQTNTITYTERVTRVSPEKGVLSSEVTTVTTQPGVIPASPDYRHQYYTYSEKHKAPVLNYGGIEEPVIIDNGDDLTPIRTLAN